ncbi:hypothetical protein AX774_g1908 [Zancudomyces culisetae]|uniref:Uncharacterized protein n=1 Tax=Zancudomyces culisetae TaxID=1213189 RepID=A0A1R1PUJ7_ZANCU|nr:hypothetical protein AX774_g1908 [Zancudomyces culisetae]|eukprot:OMH84579.1 hypothetical protein AX774_g1908 [Zancudomyces culisetae]
MVKINAEKNDEQELLKELVKLYDDFVHSTEMSAGSGSEKRTKDPYVLKQTLLNYRERAVAKKERESKVIERELVRYKDLDKSLYRRIYDAVQLFVAHQMVMDRQSAKKWNVDSFEEMVKWWDLIHNLQSNGVDDASGKSDQSTNKSTDSTKEKGETENASKDRTEKLEPVSHQNHEKELSGSLRRAPKPLPQPRLKRSGVLNQNDSKVSEEKHVEINKIEKYGHGKSQETLKEPKEDLVHDVSKDHLQKHPNPNSNPNLNPDPSPSLSQLSSSTSSSVSLAALPSSPTSGTQTEKGMDVPTTNSDNRATKNATNRTPAFSQMYTPVYISSQVPINASLPTFQLHPNAALNPNVLGKQAGVRNTKQNGQHIGGHGGLGGFMGIGQPMYAYVNTPVPYPFVVPAPMNIAPRQAYYAPGVVLPQQNYLQPGPGGLSRSNSARYSDGVQISEDLGDNPGLIEVSPNPIIEEP